MHTLSTFELIYSTTWLSVCALNLALLARHFAAVRAELRVYWQLIWVPWKLITFAPALIFLCLAGPYTNDPTWDTITGGGMALLTYLCAPWSIGVLARSFDCRSFDCRSVDCRSVDCHRWPWRRIGFALFLLFFSSSWFYDGYLLLRDGFYTPRWWSNLLISSLIFVVAGLFWNLEIHQRRDFTRQVFAFQRGDWPQASGRSYSWPPLRFLLPPICAAIFLITGFVRWH